MPVFIIQELSENLTDVQTHKVRSPFSIPKPVRLGFSGLLAAKCHAPFSSTREKGNPVVAGSTSLRAIGFEFKHATCDEVPLRLPQVVLPYVVFCFRRDRSQHGRVHFALKAPKPRLTFRFLKGMLQALIFLKVTWSTNFIFGSR
jgi:hypothetical protein